MFLKYQMMYIYPVEFIEYVEFIDISVLTLKKLHEVLLAQFVLKHFSHSSHIPLL